jgi:hypothetical protein
VLVRGANLEILVSCQGKQARLDGDRGVTFGIRTDPFMQVVGTKGVVVTKQRHGGIMQSYLFLNQMIRN